MADDNEIPDLSNPQIANDKELTPSNELNIMDVKEIPKLSNAQTADQDDLQIVDEEQLTNSNNMDTMADNGPSAVGNEQNAGQDDVAGQANSQIMSIPVNPLANLLGIPREIRYMMYKNILESHSDSLGVALVCKMPVYAPCLDPNNFDVPPQPAQLSYQYIIPKGFTQLLGVNSTIYYEFALFAARKFPIEEKDLGTIKVVKAVGYYIFHKDTPHYRLIKLGPSQFGSWNFVFIRILEQLTNKVDEIVCMTEYIGGSGVHILHWWNALHNVIDCDLGDWWDNHREKKWPYSVHCQLWEVCHTHLKMSRNKELFPHLPFNEAKETGHIFYPPSAEKHHEAGFQTFHCEGNDRLRFPRWNRRGTLDPIPTSCIKTWEKVICDGYMRHPNYKWIEHKNVSRLTPF